MYLKKNNLDKKITDSLLLTDSYNYFLEMLLVTFYYLYRLVYLLFIIQKIKKYI